MLCRRYLRSVCVIVYERTDFVIFVRSFDQLILTKIIEILATRCQILRIKCNKFDLGLGSPQTPLGELTAALP